MARTRGNATICTMSDGLWVLFFTAAVFTVASLIALWVTARRDPRRLRCAVLLLIAAFWLLVTLVTASPMFGERGQAIFLVIAGVLLVAWLAAMGMLPLLLVIDGLIVLRREGIRSRTGLLVLAAGIALLLLPGVTASLARNDRWWSMALFTLVTFIGTYLGTFLVVMLAQFVVRALFGGRRRVPDPDVLIVLGSGLINGKVPPLLASRLDRALQVSAEEALQGRRPMFVVSGGRGSDEPRAEAEAMAEYLTSRGVPDERIIVEDRSRSTRENLVNSTRLLRERGIGGPMLAVTSSYHTTRTDVLAADLRLDDVFVTGAHTAWYYAPGAYLREYIGVLTYRLPLNIGVGIFCVVAAVAMAWATSRVG